MKIIDVMRWEFLCVDFEFKGRVCHSICLVAIKWARYWTLVFQESNPFISILKYLEIKAIWRRYSYQMTHLLNHGTKSGWIMIKTFLKKTYIIFFSNRKTFITKPNMSLGEAFLGVWPPSAPPPILRAVFLFKHLQNKHSNSELFLLNLTERKKTRKENK